jgi:membrane protein involved in colicin uptake
MLGDVFTRVRKDGRRSMLFAVSSVVLLCAVMVGLGYFLLKSREQLQTGLKTVKEETQKSKEQMEEELRKTPQAAEEAKKQVERLELQLKSSDERNSANQKALMQALEVARKQSQALSRMLEQQKAKAAADAAAAAAAAAAAPAPAVLYETALADATDKLDKGQPSAAFDVATRLIQQDPNRWDAYGVAGESAAKMNDFKLAGDMFERAIARSSGEVRTYLEEQLKAVRERQK